MGINYYWRLIATLVSFICFGIGGLLVGLLAYPLLLIFVRNKDYRYLQGQKLIHYCFKLFIGFMVKIGICTVTITGLKRLQKKNLFLVANHPTLIDVAILLSLIKSTDCVVKSKLLENPFTKGPLVTAGYIVNSQPEQLINSCAQALNNNHNLLLFPEGTRTQDINKLQFMRGAAKIAIMAKKNLTPITIKCNPRMLAKGVKWYNIPSSKPHFQINVGKEIEIHQFLDPTKSENVQSRHLNKHLLNYFKGELKIAGSKTTIRN